MSENTTKLKVALLKNQDLLRYIHYLGDFNPLDASLENVDDVIVDKYNFVLTPYNPEILSQSKIMIFLNPFTGMYDKSVTADDVYALDIIVPYKFWVINETSELRAYSIAHQIAKTIDQKKVAGIGNVVIRRYKAYKVDDTFAGLTLFIEVTNASRSK